MQQIIRTSLGVSPGMKSEVEPAKAIRPESFSDYIGQTKIVNNLKVYIEAAKQRNTCIDHVLLYGPAGLGKTTLAQIIAHEMGSNLKVTSAPAIEKTGELASILCKLEEKDVLFIDEIHRLSKVVEEFLYSAMEDRVVDIVVGQGEQSRSIRLELPEFTLVGATTRAGMLSAPLRDRFGIIERLEYYSAEELSQIIQRSSAVLGVEISKEASLLLAGCSRGTPRIANNYLKRCRDFSMVNGDGFIDEGIVLSCMESLGVSREGFDELDRKLIQILEDAARPVGLSTLSSMMGEDVGTIENVVEPFLIYSGVLIKTPKGRMLAKAS